jgi:hypothetical protein
MLHLYAVKFDVKRNLEKFLDFGNRAGAGGNFERKKSFELSSSIKLEKKKEN